MGMLESKPTLPPQDLAYLTRHTHFNEAEVRVLFERFRAVSASIQKDDTIEFNEFQAALGRHDRVFTKRFFTIFDSDGNNEIDFREFCLGISVFCERGTTDEKIKYSFRIYDIDGDGNIDRNELHQLLKAALSENMLDLTDEQIGTLVDDTFAQVDSNGDGRISFEEYEQMVRAHPSFLQFLTIDTSSLFGRKDSFNED